VPISTLDPAETVPVQPAITMRFEWNARFVTLIVPEF